MHTRSNNNSLKILDNFLLFTPSISAIWRNYLLLEILVLFTRWSMKKKIKVYFLNGRNNDMNEFSRATPLKSMIQARNVSDDSIVPKLDCTFKTISILFEKDLWKDRKL